jgi:hypothetical protein
MEPRSGVPAGSRLWTSKPPTWWPSHAPGTTCHLYLFTPLYRQIKLQRGLPFDVRIPNALTTRTLNASKSGRKVKRFARKKELFADLGL